MTRLTFSRRTALFAGAALPLAGLAPRPALATAGMMGATTPTHHRFRLGGFEVTTLLVGTRTTEKPQETFGLNATPEDFAALAAANFLPADKTQNFFTPTLVNTGSELILFDTGLAPEAITGALAAAGYSPDQIDVVVLTHMHGDISAGSRARRRPSRMPAMSRARPSSITGPRPATKVLTPRSNRWPKR